MLDWAAKLLGLQEKFWNSSKQGGGQITVSNIHLTPSRLSYQTIVNARRYNICLTDFSLLIVY